MTQEQFADKLGVSYQSVSRWENGTTYPDIEFLPAIADILSCSVDDLMGIPDVKKEKKAVEAFDELRRECMKKEYDADRIVSVIREIRRNYINSNQAWRPWSEGNDRAFRDPKILPEVPLMAEAYLEKHPMHPHVIYTMAIIEDEEHLDAFLKNHTTSYDCSERDLLFNRYLLMNDRDKFEPERRYKFYQSINDLLYSCVLTGLDSDFEKGEASDEFMDSLLSLVRDKAVDNKPDMWVSDRMELGLKRAGRLTAAGKTDEALAELTACVDLFEETMKITDEVMLPTSCRWLEGMEWSAKEGWIHPDNNPDSPEERYVFIRTTIGGTTTCYCIIPSQYYLWFNEKRFDAIRNDPEFIALSERVKALIVTRPKQGE